MYMQDTNVCITLVTHNMKEFKRIKGLSLENWIRS
jgi:predicted nucleic acid-binding protein